MAYNINATEQVFDFIVQKINDKEWEPDAKIWSETKLCEELNVSRIAVRAAVEKLSTLSVLKKVQGSGTYVENVDLSDVMNTLRPIVNISHKELIDMMQFRLYFEYGNVCLFIQNCTDGDIERLEENYKLMQANMDDVEGCYIQDYNFHHMIAQCTRNSLIMKISDIVADVLKANHKYVSQSIGTEIAVRDHKNVLDYIKLRDEKMAGLFMVRHIQTCIKAMESYFEKHELHNQ